MTQQQYVINRKLNILKLGEKLGNISKACRRLRITRQHYYNIKSTLAEEGIEGLVDTKLLGGLHHPQFLS